MDTEITPTRRRRRKEHSTRHEDKLTEILTQAAQLFFVRGYDAASLDDIAAAVDVHKATLYHYISSKEEILYQCLVRSMTDYETVMAEMADRSKPALSRLRAFVDVLITSQNNDFGRCLTRVGRHPLSGEWAERIRQFQRRLDHTVRGIIQDGIAEGTIRPCDPRLATAMLFGAFNWVPRWLKPGGAITHKQIADSYIDIFVNGIGAEAVKKGRK